ncbi:PD-(D/E)XK nuclease domain-containing protein, partial [bacterium]|nr:PD-(D/E)XK nuclease domain-containing protein [bacterium]
RPDIVIPFDDKLIILEFKFAKNSSEVDKKLEWAEDQVAHYAESYKNAGKEIVTAVLVIDNKKKQVTSYQQNL